MCVLDVQARKLWRHLCDAFEWPELFYIQWSDGWRCKLNLLLLIFFQHLLGGHLILTSIETLIHFKSLFLVSLAHFELSLKCERFWISFDKYNRFIAVVMLWQFLLFLQQTSSINRVQIFTYLHSSNVTHTARNAVEHLAGDHIVYAGLVVLNVLR